MPARSLIAPLLPVTLKGAGGGVGNRALEGEDVRAAAGEVVEPPPQLVVVSDGKPVTVTGSLNATET